MEESTHLCPGTYFSPHLKHIPLARRCSRSYLALHTSLGDTFSLLYCLAGEATISQSYRVSEFIAAAGEGRREQGRRG
jgi:hypothetical protein